MNEIMKVSTNPEDYKCRLKTPTGVVHCDKDTGSPITTHGYLPHFAQFLHEGGQFAHLVDTCPLTYKSNNAPAVKDVLGTIMLSILSGHNRYCHAACLYGDAVAAEMLGLNQIMSHDAVARGLDKIDESKAEIWLSNASRKMYESLLTTPYVLDLDPTVKTLYGNQEGAVPGYNPQKPGRNSHSLHSYFIGSLRILLDVEVHPGNETAGKYSQKRLWELIDELPPQCRPYIIRGDIGYGNEQTMYECEKRRQNFLLKLKQSRNVKKLIQELEKPGYNWKDAGKGWLGHESELQLHGWTKKRRVIVLKRRHGNKEEPENLLPETSGQMQFPLEVVTEISPVYEYQVLVTNLELEIPAVAQLYRDRGDAENNFDELKNQWGWSGFNSRKLPRTQIMMRLVGLVYNWWNIFCRLAEPEKHQEAITSRKLYQNTIGRLVRTKNTRKFYVTAVGEEATKVMLKLTRISRFISNKISTATQLTKEQKWAAILDEAFKYFKTETGLRAASEGNQILLNL